MSSFSSSYYSDSICVNATFTMWTASRLLIILCQEQSSTVVAHNNVVHRKSASSFQRKVFSLKAQTLVFEVTNQLSAHALVESVITYFRHKGYKVERDTIWEGKASGLSHKFDLIIQKGNERRLVWIRAWRRTVGVNMVINMDKAAEDVGVPSPIMISEKFSGHAKAYANRRGVSLLTKQEMLQRLR